MSAVWLYLCDDLPAPGSGFVAEHLPRLPPFRQEKCARYHRDSDKIACIVSYLLLSKGLREHYGLESSGEFSCNRHGKPYLKDHPEVFFNLSHCKCGVACALANVEVGVDIQDVRPFSASLARRICSEREQRELSASADPAKLFCRFWTEKESYAKAWGISVVTLFGKDLPGGAAAYRETGDYCMTLRCKDTQGETPRAEVFFEGHFK